MSGGNWTSEDVTLRCGEEQKTVDSDLTVSGRAQAARGESIWRCLATASTRLSISVSLSQSETKVRGRHSAAVPTEVNLL